MDVFPAVDLMNGKIVRLTQGDPDTSKTYESFGDPVSAAKRWEEKGADAIHIIDLDAALNRGDNLEEIKKIARVVDVPIQVGGGIRSREAAQSLLRGAVDRVIVGSMAFKKPRALKELLKDFGPERIVVALDHRGGEVMIQGWRDSTKLNVEEAVTQFLHIGMKLFLITSITRDGTLTGPDYKTLDRACDHSGANIIAAGGVGSLEDLVHLKRIGVWGVVIGKALYENVFDLEDALDIARRTD
jgi:phosphoribosylformimino-5-aminoimidazole carboxamide ribotide isomerase